MSEIPYGYEVFHSRDYHLESDPGGSYEPGWYWWSCFPGCIPDGEPSGPFESEEKAIEDLREGMGEDEAETL
jgi:hypothetical protein